MQKSILLLIAGAFVFNSSFSQSTENSDKKAPNGWHQLDKTETGFNGISLNKAYDFLKAKKIKSKKVLVAVIDSGIDTLHEDLKPVLWTNPKEIPGNGIDDDKNGYVDDVHGWNFIGGKDGKNVKEDSDEGSRVYHKLKQKWDGITITESNLSPADLKSYQTYVRAKEKVVGEINEAEIGYLKTLSEETLKVYGMIKDTYIQNQLDEVTALINSTLYKLRFLK